MADASQPSTGMPFSDLMGIEIVTRDKARVVGRMRVRDDLCTAGGILHGGALMSLADSVGALVAFLGLPEGASTATITSTTQLFRPVSAGGVRAVAETLHRGRTTVTVRTSLYDDQDRLVAQTTQVQAVIAAR